MDRAASNLDRISALPDELLHAILTFLGDAPAVTRTVVLSRRWRHVWTGATNLEFKDSDMLLQLNKSRFSSFVDWVLARRGDAPMESLRIHMRDMAEAAACSSPAQLNEWICYAAQHVVKTVNIYIGNSRDSNPDQRQAIELPSHGGRIACISLYLPRFRFKLPADVAAARYEALTDLHLFSMSFSEDGGSTLGDFVSSCCPQLRRLQICSSRGLRQLVLRSDVLQEFHISGAEDLQKLEVQAPNLQIIKLSMCFRIRRRLHPGSGKLARIVAPKLKEIHTMDYPCSKPTDLDIHDLASVRRLSNLSLQMHDKYHRDMDIGFWLLENCPNVEHVGVNLHHEAHRRYGAMAGELADLTTSEGKAAYAKVTKMDVCKLNFPNCHLVASMSSLLARWRSHLLVTAALIRWVS